MTSRLTDPRDQTRQRLAPVVLLVDGPSCRPAVGGGKSRGRHTSPTPLLPENHAHAPVPRTAEAVFERRPAVGTRKPTGHAPAPTIDRRSTPKLDDAPLLYSFSARVSGHDQPGANKQAAKNAGCPLFVESENFAHTGEPLTLLWLQPLHILSMRNKPSWSILSRAPTKREKARRGQAASWQEPRREHRERQN